jgi:xanthine dehydrogenase YagS FAD-binding subunit
MRPFEYRRPASIGDASALLARQHGSSAIRPRLLAGGTDLLPMMKNEIDEPTLLIDIKRLNELDDTIVLNADGLRIGALATLAQIEESPLVHITHPALCQAAAAAASPQIRNMATIGGNLLQRPRCWYFRDHEVPCWLKGGDDCPAADGENQLHAIFGESICRAVHPSDPATALLALDASVVVRGPSGERAEPLDFFFAMPNDDRRNEHTLRPDELITAITIPNHSATALSAYLKAMDRKVWAFALVGVGVMLDIDDEQTIVDARLVLGGVAPIPWRVPAAETLLIGATPDEALFARVAEAALAEATPLAHNGYKIPLAKTLVKRALEAASIPVESLA